MPRTDRAQVFLNGVLQSETTQIIDDETILREGANTRLGNAYGALRQWAADGQAAYDDWPTKTAAQKDAALREVIRRFGVLCDRLADTVTRLT